MMTKPNQFARPVMRSRTSFHANDTRSKRAEIVDDLRAAKPQLGYRAARRIRSVHLEDILCN